MKIYSTTTEYYPFRSFFTLTILVFTFITPSFSQIIETDWLFYCNENENLSKIWRINDSQSLATRRIEYGKPQIKDIVLLEDGLIRDSLNLKKVLNTNGYMLQHVDNIDILSDTSAYIRSGLMAFKVFLKERRISFDSTFYKEIFIPDRKKMMAYSMELMHTYIFRYKNIIIGYDKENFKNKKGRGVKVKNDEKNLPKYWIMKKEVWEKNYINKAKKEVTQDIFVDIKDWDQVWLRTLVFTSHVKILPNDKILFCLSKTNEIYIYDHVSGNIERYSLPAVENGESFNFYYDVKFDHYYLIKKTSENYIIFRTNKDFSKFYQIKSIDNYPQSVYGGRVNTKKEFKVDRENMICHYAIPIYDDVPPAKFLKIDSLDIYNNY